ncbi:MAG TPA: phenylalanine--tRNA ligase subunit alpha [bacterium]|nr:phenylalanine--tRNA ligase subunit alpha [bacterium]
MDKEEIIKKCRDVFNRGKEELEKLIDENDFEKWRTKFFGRKGEINKLFSFLSTIKNELKPEIGEEINKIKINLMSLFEEKKEIIQKERNKEKFNLSFPGKIPEYGGIHPLTQIMKKMTKIFENMGFGIFTGPEIETDFYNFEALNTPEDHPARDIWDTFYLDYKKKILLRTHTSPVQIRVMETNKPPFRIIALGKCFRRDQFDSSHSPAFHQMEGLMVDKNISFTHLKGILNYFLKEMFGENIKVKFTPSYFPFTEPSAEVSISCVICGGKGCSTCKNSGFLEILGCGMVHPQVFRNVGYNPEEITGFAFGMGVERIAMLKYKIDDIRLFYNNDLRFLKQF